MLSSLLRHNTTPDLDRAYRPARDVAAARQGESIVLLDVRRGRYHSLGGSAADIWDGLAEGQTPAVIVNQLHSAYGVPKERLEADVTMLLIQLLRVKLVESAQ